MDTLECAQGLFNGHKDAVVEFNWRNSLVVSGDRGGSMAIWDVNTGQALREMKGIHKGHIAKIQYYSDGQDNNLILSTGLKDGQLIVHDMRSHQPIKFSKIHGGAINFIDTTLSGFIVTGSADKTLKSFDIFNDFKPVHVMKATDAIFCG